jgi:DNA-binding GntR family transcriptional regulator
MDFREATDSLFLRVDQDALARTLGVSVALVRQARLRPEAAAHRSPPPNWKEAVIKLAEEQEYRYRTLLEVLRTEDAH